MALHHETGRRGEKLAEAYLVSEGFAILHRNWRHSRYEIDLIATKENILHFIEVKTRRNVNFGMPEENVDARKLEHVMAAADEFLYQNPQWNTVQYDVLSITLDKDDHAEFFLIEDVYL
jgi:putative endonuclease